MGSSASTPVLSRPSFPARTPSPQPPTYSLSAAPTLDASPPASLLQSSASSPTLSRPSFVSRAPSPQPSFPSPSSARPPLPTTPNRSGSLQAPSGGGRAPSPTPLPRTPASVALAQHKGSGSGSGSGASQHRSPGGALSSSGSNPAIVAVEEMAAPETGGGGGDSRTVRLFLSSTFRDMVHERDALFKSAVPRIRRALADRGLFFVAVDLRWGITEAAAKGGEVVRLCLREVLRSKYFISFLKRRYGWHQDPSAPHDALFAKSVDRAATEFPFLRSYPGRSVTEWECRLGAFLDAAGHANVRKDTSRFYFANAALMAAAAKEEASQEGAYASQRLEALKAEISGTPGMPVGEYSGAADLANSVYNDFMQMVERDFPRGREKSWLQAERQAHEAFGQARRRLYYGARSDYERMDAYAAGAGPEILLVRGESGAGKSALMANWSESWRRRHPGDLIIVHFVGGSQQSARVSNLIQRVSEETRERFPLLPALDMGGSEGELMARFATWLSEAAVLFSARVVLVADALDQLADDGDAQRLSWLPPAAAPSLRFILSCVPGRAMDAAEARPHLPHVVTPLDNARRRGVIEADLRQAGKSLSEAQMERLLGAEQCANPLFLMVLLEELETGAVYETLDPRMEELLRCREPRELYGKVIERWAGLYGETLVQGCLCAIVCSRHGMADAELQLLLGVGSGDTGSMSEIVTPASPADAGAVSPLTWAEFLAVANSILINRDGLYGFFHRAANEAVEELYGIAAKVANVSGKGAGWQKARAAGRALRRNKWHARLGEFFAKQPPSRRKADEAPWQLARAKEKEKLAQVLTDLDVLRRLMDSSATRHELVQYWVATGAKDGAPKRYEKAIGRAAAGGETGVEVAMHWQRAGALLRLMGLFGEATPFLERSVQLLDEAGSDGLQLQAAGAYEELANLYADRGRYDRALPLLQKAMGIRTETQGGRHPDVAGCLDSIALLHAHRGELQKAEDLFTQAKAIREAALGDRHPDVALSLDHIAALDKRRGRYDDAEQRLRKALQIRQAVLGKDHPDVAATLNVLSQINTLSGRHDEAEQLVTHAMQIRQRALGEDHPKTADCLRALAALRMAQGQPEEAEKLCRKALELQKVALGRSHPDVASTEHQLATICDAQGRFDEAEERFLRALAIWEARFAFNHAYVAETLSALISMFMAQGLQRRLEDFLRTRNSDPALALRDCAAICALQGMFPQAAAMYNRALEMAKTALGPRHPEVGDYISALAMFHADQQEFWLAEPMLQEALELRKSALGANDPKVADSLFDLAAFYKRQHHLKEAEPLLRRCLDIRDLQLGAGSPEAAAAARELAAVCVELDMRSDAMQLYQRLLESNEAVAAAGQDEVSVAATLHELATQLYKAGDTDAALAASERAMPFCERALGRSDPRVEELALNLGAIALKEYRPIDAERLYRRVLDNRKGASGGKEGMDVAGVQALEGLAAAYVMQGKTNDAAEQYERLLHEQRRSAFVGPDHPSTSDTMQHLADIRSTQQNKAPEAEALYTQALELRRRLFGQSDRKVAETMLGLAKLLSANGRHAEAEPLFRQCLEMPTGSSAALIEVLGGLADAYEALHRRSEAAATLQRLLAMQQASPLLGKDAPETVATAYRLGRALAEERKYELAEPLLQRAVAAREKKMGGEHAETAEASLALADVLKARGKYTEASVIYQKWLRLRLPRLGGPGAEQLQLLRLIASLQECERQQRDWDALSKRVLESQAPRLDIKDQRGPLPGQDEWLWKNEEGVKRWNEAMDALKRSGPTSVEYAKSLKLCEDAFTGSLAVREKHLGPTDARCAIAADNLGLLHVHRGNNQLAEVLFKRSLALQDAGSASQKGNDARMAALADTVTLLSALVLRRDDYKEAETLLNRALDLRKRALGPNDPKVAASLFSLAQLYAAQQKLADAEPLYKRCMEARLKSLGEKDGATVEAMMALATLFNVSGRPAEAEPVLRRALGAREKALGPNHHEVADVLSELAASCLAQRRAPEAEKLHKRALEIRELRVARSPDHVRSLAQLAALYLSEKKPAEAEPLVKKLQKILSDSGAGLAPAASVPPAQGAPGRAVVGPSKTH
eukprot:tig00020943_g16323.t1